MLKKWHQLVNLVSEVSLECGAMVQHLGFELVSGDYLDVGFKYVLGLTLFE